ncbi:YhdP family protein [Paracidovorax valerianellae]|uniref:TIGR02099 family protein n=1 Tax=Paracidovorax valerianellae TaxID=187868 RepID=A0A1G6S1L7_9BURK|nr:YhdP family protein [Paracidovorax valerianellae]MDA8444138.1 TIGR02099 family protein [Paracidovorax valerianellae]SDD10057.1 TIGR02099 family protein [Paracidovorax valerianellae]
MIEQPPHPSRLLRCLAGLARWSLGLLIAFWLLVAVAWGVLHGWIVPRIGDFRPQLETHATRALGVPVRIGALSARSDGLVPTFELNDVALLDPEGRVALKLPRVVGSLSPRSLLRRGFEQLYIERPELDVRRLADGRIFIAGLAFRQTEGGDSAGADWLFSQSEVVLRGGMVRLTDEQSTAPPLALEQVDLLLRNRGWGHNLRIKATPPAQWGDRFKLTGQFRQPFLTTHDGSWQQWTGQLFADFSRVDVSRLRHHVHIDGVQVAEGRGALRAWIDFQRGQFVGGTADLALADVNAQLGAKLEPLALQSVSGRVGGRRLSDGFEFSTEGLQFTTQDALRWPGGNLTVRHTGRNSSREQGELRADRLDLAALAQIASRLPLEPALHAALADYAPRGLVGELKASWRGPLDHMQQYQARGKVTGLALADQPRPEGAASGVPGLRGADVEFDVSQAGGKASLAMANGALVLPKVFEEGTVPMDRLAAKVRWQIEGQRIAVQADDLQFANADAQGEAKLAWHTTDAERSGARSRFPGVLDLSGALQRADGTRVHRYLPLSIPPDTRHYVRDAVTAGTASNVQFRVKGDLHDIPFNAPGQGEFHIAARVKDVTYAYVPPRLQHANEAPWPALTELAGELIFDRSSMAVKGASGSFAGTPKLRVNKVEARIPDLAHSVVAVNADARGPLADMLSFVTTSPLSHITGNALDKTTANGDADLQLALSLPISHIDQSKVQGRVTLAGNDVRIAPDAPAIARARGAVQFTDTGFTLAGVQGRALGGDLRLEGGMRALPAGALPVESAVQVRAQGVATAEGLRQATQWPGLAQLAQRATGSTPYALALGVRRGTPEVQVTTTLQGMAFDLPAPLGKTAEAMLPIRFETQLTRESLVAGAPLHEQLALDLGTLGSVTYVRDISSATQPRVLRGAIALGLAPGEAAPLPERGVVANVQIGELDADAWHAVLHGGGPSPAKASAAAPSAEAASATAAVAAAPASSAPGSNVAPNGAVGAVASGAGAPAESSPMQEYLPTQLAVRARQVDFQGRSLHSVVMGGSRDGNTWRANVDAQELNGYVEFRQGAGIGADGSAGRVFARLSRLAVPQSDAKEVDALLAEEPAAGAGTLPSLDIVVDDFELRGRRLGRIEIEAQNRGGDGAPREWRLAKFNIVAPEATLTANGNWALLGSESGADARRRTVMNFKLDIRDSGDLLARFGMADVVRRGKGRMEGQVAWMGPPLTPDYRTMSGQMNVNVESGQFLKADPGLAKLLGVLSLQSLPRRLTLDFRDVFSEGFAFDFVRGDVRMEQGVANTNNLQMKGVNAAVLMEGSADLDRETQDLHVVVVPEINAMTASLVATAINPVVGLGSFLAQVFLRGPLIQAATQEFRIDGTWTDPRIERVPRRKLGSAGVNTAKPPDPEPPNGDKS